MPAFVSPLPHAPGRRRLLALTLATLWATLGVIGPGATAHAQSEVRFVPGVDVNVGLGPSSVATGDFNGDGADDFAVGRSSGAVVVKLNNRGGGFVTPAEIPFNARPLSITAGYFDADAFLDLAVTGPGNTQGVVKVYRGDGGGGFTLYASATTSQPTPVGIALGDFNGDRRPDIIVGNTGQSVDLLLNTGSGNLSVATTVQVDMGARALAVADFNRDNKLDFAAANSSPGTVSVVRGNGDGTFSGVNTQLISQDVVDVDVGDFNRDGAPDLAAASATDDTAKILTNDGNGGLFGSITSVPVGDNPREIVVSDFDGDRRSDLATANRGSGAVSVRLGRGDGTFANTLEVPVRPSPVSLATGDFDGDGQPDLATANDEGSGTVSVRLAQRPLREFGSSSLTFDPQPVGTLSAARTVSVINTGPLDLRPTRARITGEAASDFLIASETCTGEVVRPGNACAVQVRFSPESVGSRDVTLVLDSNSSQRDTVRLTGSGADAPAGSTGPTGPAGPAGPAGGSGPAGQTGPAGSNGPAGQAGPAGPAGPSGNDGSAGAAGAPGADGSTGPQGPTGPAGAVYVVPGKQGADGARGPRGKQGKRGRPGVWVFGCSARPAPTGERLLIRCRVKNATAGVARLKSRGEVIATRRIRRGTQRLTFQVPSRYESHRFRLVVRA